MGKPIQITCNGKIFRSTHEFCRQTGISGHSVRMAIANKVPLESLRPARSILPFLFEGKKYASLHTFAGEMVRLGRTNATKTAIAQRLKAALRVNNSMRLTDKAIRKILSQDLCVSGLGYSYSITCTKTNKQYFGVTKGSWQDRRHNHFQDSKNLKKKTLLAKSIRKYGWRSHVFKMLGSHPIAQLGEVEKNLIKDNNSLKPAGLNMHIGGASLRYRNSTNGIFYKGVAYNNLTELARSFNLNARKFRDRLSRNPDLELCLAEEFTHTKYRHLKYNGKEFIGYPELAKEYGVNFNSLKVFVRNGILAGHSFQKALNLAMKDCLALKKARQEGRLCKVCGKRFIPRYLKINLVCSKACWRRK